MTISIMSFVLCVTNNDKHLFKTFEKKLSFLENLDGMLHRYYMHSDVCDILKSYITLMCVIRRGCFLSNTYTSYSHALRSKFSVSHSGFDDRSFDLPDQSIFFTVGSYTYMLPDEIWMMKRPRSSEVCLCLYINHLATGNTIVYDLKLMGTLSYMS